MMLAEIILAVRLLRALFLANLEKHQHPAGDGPTPMASAMFDSNNIGFLFIANPVLLTQINSFISENT